MNLSLTSSILQRGTGTQRCRDVLYRALQTHPAAKIIYLDGVRACPELLQEMIDLLQEKQLHLRTMLDEIPEDECDGSKYNLQPRTLAEAPTSWPLDDYDDGEQEKDLRPF